jgi:hypothetical protein
MLRFAVTPRLQVHLYVVVYELHRVSVVTLDTHFVRKHKTSPNKPRDIENQFVPAGITSIAA